MKKTFADRLALGVAKDASENNFSSRCGIYVIEGIDRLAIYNNNPVPSRAMDLALFRACLAADGIEVLAVGSYPPAGAEDEGYTISLILSVGQAQLANVTRHWNSVARRSECGVM